MKAYKGGALSGSWLVTRKIDGIRMLRDEKSHPVSRSGKPLYNLGFVPLYITDAEIFCGSWNETVSAVRSRSATVQLTLNNVYPLDTLDPRLILVTLVDPTEARILQEFDLALKSGDEGLVLYGPNGQVLKVKEKQTHDVVVTEIIPGKGKHLGRMGALRTPMGKVGTGFTDEQRREYRNLPLGTTIEVECMELTKDGNFRNPRFVRVREDK